MLFKRKNKENFWLKIRDFVWPRCGWKRSFLYIKHRLIRLPHSTRDIAMGLSAGVVISWTPTLSLQLLQCYIFCKIVRANFLASVLGSLIGNPWTFPIFFWISYLVGDFFLSTTGLGSFINIISGGAVIPDDHGSGMLGFIPMLIGGYIMAILTFPICYYIFFYLIEGARAAKIKMGEKVHVIKEHRNEVKMSKKKNK